MPNNSTPSKLALVHRRHAGGTRESVFVVSGEGVSGHWHGLRLLFCFFSFRWGEITIDVMVTPPMLPRESRDVTVASSCLRRGGK